MSSQKIKILYVLTSLRIGGAEKIVAEFSLKLREENDYSIEIFIMDGSQTPLIKLLEDNGIVIHKASKGYFQMWNLWHYKKLKELIEKNNYNIIHVHNTSAQFIAYLAGLNTRKKIKFITTEHNTYNRRRGYFIFKLLDKKLYNFYDKVICVSYTTKKNLLSHLSLPNNDNKFVTINNGIDLTKFRITKTEKPEEYKDKVIILMVSAFRKQKDQPTLIRALRYLSEDYIVWLAGEGSRKKKCELLVKKLNLENQVTFLGNRNDTPELYSMADMIVISSHYEGMSLASLEALASGKPVIASDVEGLREIVKGVGVLFKENDEKDLALKIKALWENENNRNINSNSVFLSRERFDFKMTFKEYLNIYNNIGNRWK